MDQQTPMPWVTFWSQAISCVSGLATFTLLLITFYYNKKITDANRELIAVSKESTQSSKESSYLNIHSKQADMFNEFNKQYALIWELRLHREVQDDPSIFYNQFWSLQRQQFETYKFGLIADEQFDFWMRTRNIEWRHMGDFGGVGWRQGFENSTRGWPTSDFEPFMRRVFETDPRNPMPTLQKPPILERLRQISK